jgi:hypothetical protein
MTTDEAFQDLVRAARRAERPSAADRSAVRAALAGALVTSIAGSAAATTALKTAAVAAKGPALTMFVLPFVTGAVLGGAVSTAVFVASRGPEEPAAPAAQSAPVQASPSDSARPLVKPFTAAGAANGEGAPEPPAEADRVPEQPAAVARRFSPEPPSTPVADPLEAESRALAEVQRALRDGQPARALSLLDVADRAYPRGALVEERAAARVFALCALRRVSEAERAAKEFARKFPRSPHAERVRASCGSAASSR